MEAINRTYSANEKILSARKKKMKKIDEKPNAGQFSEEGRAQS